ncbi:hypothetical protein ACTPEF_25155 [Clostridioides difficile]
MTSISFGMWTNGYKYGKKAVESILQGAEEFYSTQKM